MREKKKNIIRNRKGKERKKKVKFGEDILISA